MSKIKVGDMPDLFRAIMRERGYTDSDRLSPRQAVRELAAWHLGEPQWADTFLDAFSVLCTIAEAASDPSHA